jgi:NTP pyrophosphatase (non-canonical NTP hydrolase)
MSEDESAVTGDDIVRLELTETQAKDMLFILDYAAGELPDPEDMEPADDLAEIVSHAIEGRRGSSLEWYQDVTEETAIYPDAHLVGMDDESMKSANVDTGLLYCVLGLNGEAGEVAERVKKDIRGDDPDEPLDIGDEIGDVLWYLVRVCDEMGYSFDAVARRNVRKLTDRKDRGVLKGSGDDR